MPNLDFLSLFLSSPRTHAHTFGHHPGLPPPGTACLQETQEHHRVLAYFELGTKWCLEESRRMQIISSDDIRKRRFEVLRGLLLNQTVGTLISVLR